MPDLTLVPCIMPFLFIFYAFYELVFSGVSLPFFQCAIHLLPFFDKFSFSDAGKILDNEQKKKVEWELRLSGNHAMRGMSLMAGC